MTMQNARMTWILLMCLLAVQSVSLQHDDVTQVRPDELLPGAASGSSVREEVTHAARLSPESGEDTSCVRCLNGGRALRSKQQCSCVCPDQWQGEACQQNKTEMGIGVELTISGDIHLGYHVWPIIVAFAMDSLNYFCNAHPHLCCTHGHYVASPDTQREFGKASQIRLGSGYPSRLTDHSFSILFYAKQVFPNELCSSVNTSSTYDAISSANVFDTETNSSQLDKAEGNMTVAGLVPQEILWQAVRLNKMVLKKDMWECCGMELITLFPGEIITNPTRPIAPLWLTIMVCCCTVSIVFCSVIIPISLLRTGSRSLLLQG